MTTIHLTATTPVAPERIVSAFTDFTPQRLRTFPNIDATSSPQEDAFASALDDPLLVSLPAHPQTQVDPRWKIPPSQWGIVLQRVEQGEPLRHIARGDARVV